MQASTTPAEITETVAGLVCEVVTLGSENRKLQDCLAGLLREQGWICSPPAPEQHRTPRQKRRG